MANRVRFFESPRRGAIVVSRPSAGPAANFDEPAGSIALPHAAASVEQFPAKTESLCSKTVAGVARRFTAAPRK